MERISALATRSERLGSRDRPGAHAILISATILDEVKLELIEETGILEIKMN